MAFATLRRIRIAAIASAVPRQVLSNSDYTLMSEDKRNRIIKYTGIQFRRWAPRELCCSDLCQAAAEKVLDDLGWDRSEIGAVVFVSQTPDYIAPATAQLIQHRMGLPKSCLAFDVNLGCSGYTYGLYILGSLLEATGLKRGLMLAGDVSKMLGDSDPASAVLFGHGASATAMECADNTKPLYFETGSDGSGFKVIHTPAGGARNPMRAESFVKQPLEGGGSRCEVDVILDAAEIMNFTLREVPGSVKRLLEYAARDAAGVDAFVFHQANLLINMQVGRKIGLKPEQAPTSLHDFGNTSSASIPITITSQLRERLSAQPMKVVLSGFGIGLSWASVYWDAENVVCPELIEL
jgi:3-oxoacyl-[acyl-carrier-protein] synthase-3